jgi:hypothetical protein
MSSRHARVRLSPSGRPAPGLGLDRGVVDAQQPRAGAAQVAAQPRLALQRSDKFVTPACGPLIGAVDQGLQVLDELGAYGGVVGGLVGVVADHEPHGPRPAVAGPAGGDVDLLDAQVAGHRAVPAGAGQRRGGRAGACLTIVVPRR